MSYTLIRAHWKFGSGTLETAEEKISLHLDESDFAAFSRQIIMEGLQKTPPIKYRTEGVSEISHANGNLYHEVKMARDAGKLGIWKKMEEVVVV